MGKKYYVVWDGVESGVFDSWEECEAMTKGFPGARYKSFKSLEAAIAAYRGTDEENMDLLKAIASHDSKKVNYEAFPEIDRGAVAVDAACSGNPGDMEYRGVDMATGEELFHVGPLPGGGVFQCVAQALLVRVRKAWQLVLILVLLCFFSSMLVTNDVALITFVPFTLIVLDMMGPEVKRGLVVPVAVLQTVAANLGSMLTPIGNPAHAKRR